jgi:hypothetical protein
MSMDLTVPNSLSSGLQPVKDQDGNSSALRLNSNGVVAIVGRGGAGETAGLSISTYPYAPPQQPDVQIVATDLGGWTANLAFKMMPAQSSAPERATYNTVLQLGGNGTVSMPAMPNRPSGNADLTINAQGVVSPQGSSARFMENIEPLQDDFEKLFLLQPRSFNYRDSGERGIGYTAEEVAQVGLDTLVANDAEGRPLTVHYKMLSVYLLELVRQQRGELAALRGEVDALKADVRGADA